MFLTNPAPICVLDEVDAPLDDHNVERFCDLLDEMTRSTDTRFVIITHNPITMARMNRLFGVTMAERGVSQLVSVDLEAAVRFREASLSRARSRSDAPLPPAAARLPARRNSIGPDVLPPAGRAEHAGVDLRQLAEHAAVRSRSRSRPPGRYWGT